MPDPDIFLDLLSEYHHDALDDGVELFNSRPHLISFVKDSKTKVYFHVYSGSNKDGYDIIFNIRSKGAYVEDMCTCKGFARYGCCHHVIAAALTYLTAYLNTPPGEIESLLDYRFQVNDYMVSFADRIITGPKKPASDKKTSVLKKTTIHKTNTASSTKPPPAKQKHLNSLVHLEIEPVPQLLFKEFEQKYLMLKPQFQYDDVLLPYQSDPENFLRHLPDGTSQVIVRNQQLEKAFYNELKELHPSFAKQFYNDFLFLPFDDALKDNWFVETVRKIQERKIPVHGILELEKFRFNTAHPKWTMKTSSSIDWFDVKINISFGEYKVPLREIRKALLNNQKMVLLGDGTYGMLPEEWLQQYGMLLKLGELQKNNTLRVSKFHFTIIDQLQKQINNKQIAQEIEEKKTKLLNIDSVTTVAKSPAVNATLRPYQLSGFQWMQVLDEMGWGGCLADDMGLGKTLQTITFLQYLKEKYADSTHLVVSPTSLIYNWEADLKKFAPELRYHIYYGGDREFTETHFEDYDLIISSYGVVRNDVSHLQQFQWHYVILDESQTIKSPTALTTRAVQLLKAKNRLALSGTPVQNNTFDLYSQFHFLNPGILGTKEFFREEFANPIDKFNNSDKSAELRKLVYPFLLRRTKEQVATDLPPKTETILWCEMGKEQRRVYDEHRNYYRDSLMNRIDELGMDKAGIYVLEGLLRLRQICDSPVLLPDNDPDINHSVKIEELMREIRENTGTHKLLVFSQFTAMLHLIQKELQQGNIRHSYLDGSTSADNRRLAVDQFQNDDSVKVFLISLKAGGVGLNLTAADYVYIVDPWWNPAAEQQAIDRAHRIGQKNKIFAYKMICKDTVEEKILQLQDRKKQLANDLITEDTGFIKKLSKEDVAFLFS